MIRELLDDAKKEFNQVKEDFKKEISKFRTGRATATILDGILINYYGTPTPINQMATIGVPEANLIVIQPWDKKYIAEIENVIRNSNLGLNPISDGKSIKLPIPPLDEEKRLEIIKMLKRYTEERKTKIRNIRREYREMAKEMKDNKDISEDEEKRFYEDLQKEVDSAIKELDELEKDKEKHILED